MQSVSVMLVYVEIIGGGRRREAREPCAVDPALPVWVLTSAPFLEAMRQPVSGGACRLFHLEARRFIEEACVGDAGVRELDTLVIVNDPALDDPEVVARRFVRN